MRFGYINPFQAKNQRRLSRRATLPRIEENFLVPELLSFSGVVEQIRLFGLNSLAPMRLTPEWFATVPVIVR